VHDIVRESVARSTSRSEASQFHLRIAAAAGDVAWALRAAEAAINADPDFSFTFSGAYVRLARHWATAMSGGDPLTSAAEMERIIASSSPATRRTSTPRPAVGE
jgi:hypothetical protein